MVFGRTQCFSVAVFHRLLPRRVIVIVIVVVVVVGGGLIRRRAGAPRWSGARVA